MTLGPSAALIQAQVQSIRRRHAAKIRAYSASRPKAVGLGADS